MLFDAGMRLWNVAAARADFGDVAQAFIQEALPENRPSSGRYWQGAFEAVKAKLVAILDRRIESPGMAPESLK
jgi:hypothetical protein